MWAISDFSVRKWPSGFGHRKALRGFYSLTFLNRSELVITETELRLIAAAARIGLNNNPKKG
jgi:hypothetical protein